VDSIKAYLVFRKTPKELENRWDVHETVTRFLPN
jgi:hypothetical protein